MPDTPPTPAANAPEASAIGRHSLAALRARFGEHHRWWVLLTVMIGNMAALMAATTVNVAVPAISRQFSLGQHDAQGLATSFMGAMTVSMLCTLWLLQRLGYRRCYGWLLVLLGLGGLAGGLSPHIGLLVMTSSFAVMAGVGSATAVAWVTLWAVVGRIGLGCVTPSLSLSSMRALDGPRIAAGAGTTNFIRQLAGAIGVNGVGIVLEGRLLAHAALGAAGTLRAFHEVFILMAGITAAAAVAAWQMKPRPSPA